MFIWGVVPVISPVVFAIVSAEEQPEQIALLFKINNFDKRTSSDIYIVFIVCYVSPPIFQIAGKVFLRLPITDVVIIHHTDGEIVFTAARFICGRTGAANSAVATLAAFFTQSATPPLDTSAIQSVRRRLILLLGT